MELQCAYVEMVDVDERVLERGRRRLMFLLAAWQPPGRQLATVDPWISVAGT